LPKEANVVYIGRKPAMNYVLAVITSFNGPNTDEIVLKARGGAISRAVDVAEIARRRFLENVKVDKIEIGSEEIPIEEENRVKTVSTMEITLTRAPSIKKEEREKSKKAEPVTPTHHIELTSIEGIGAKRAEKLKSCGVSSVQDLANFDARELSDKLQVSEKKVSKWIDEAKKALEHSNGAGTS